MGDQCERTPADATTAIRNWLIYREARYTEDDLWMVLGELERLSAVNGELRAESALRAGDKVQVYGAHDRHTGIVKRLGNLTGPLIVVLALDILGGDGGG